MTTSPGPALQKALVDYLQTAIAATAGLAQSSVVVSWPEPTVDLQLSSTRIVVACILAGAPKVDDTIGGPRVIKVTNGVSPAATATLDEATLEQPLTLGVYAESKALRDDADDVLYNILNKPFWSTVSPVADTTLYASISPGDAVEVTPASMADIWPGTTLVLDEGESNEEIVVVTEIKPTSFIARIRKAHSSGAAVEEIESRIESYARGLHLRCSTHHNAIARYDFDDPQYLDDSEGSQRQEWKSLWNGTGYIMRLRNAAIIKQTTLTLELNGIERVV